jgi:hypothetical protein
MKTLMLLVLATGISQPLFAAGHGHSGGSEKVINLSLTPDIALRNRHDTIIGFSLSFWGENQQRSFALGLVNGVMGHSAGFAFGLFNYGENYKGAMISVVNYLKKDFLGFQFSVANYVEGNMQGLQLGAANYSSHLEGVQFGFVNYAKTTGDFALQIGVVNIITENKKWFGEFPKAVAPAMILANWRF